ncbi:hypothetical protein [Geodermatophilus sp. CPCC 206100]|uniref:hypothetical protein n=1 Tax=Geodermatophilus sp. CPCC 206100 TaxID=3020054 RepID=UPI003B008161
MELPAALYEPVDGGYRATALTIGPWDPGLQHAGPPAALLAREAERSTGIPDGQFRALEWRFARGSFNAPGPAAAWTRTRCALVAGEPMTPLQHLLVMTDAASGISAVLDWTRASFANVDLSVALTRPPAGEWLGVDAATTIGPAGAGQCFADLHDARGRVGRSTQSLFVELR